MKRVTVFLLLAALMCNVGFAEGVSFAEGKYPTADFKSHVITGGFWGSPDVDFALGAPLLELTFGGGFEFQYAASSAFVIEFGGRFENPAGKERKAFRAYTNSSPLLTIGCRTLL